MHHIVQWLFSQLGHIITTVRLIIRFLRFAGAAVKYHLRTSTEFASRNAPTASVIRGSRTRLRWHQWFKARELEREGHGVIRSGHYEKWVNVTSPGVVMAMQMRGAFSSHRQRD
jgi:hypothetical protein